MGLRGPAPQPKKEAEKKGLYRPSRHEDEIALNVAEFDMHDIPEVLNDVGKVEWQRIKELTKGTKGWVMLSDQSALTLHCILYQELMQSYQEMKSHGRVTISNNGARRRSSEFTNFIDMVKHYTNSCREFGLTPSARTRVKIEQEVEEEKGFRKLK